MKITKLIIDENRWLRSGKNGGLISDSDYSKLPLNRYYNAQLPPDKTTSSALLDVRTQRMCCLGFAACAAGVPKKHIKDVGTPASIETGQTRASERARNKMRKTFPWLFNSCNMDSGISHILMDINDNPKISLPYKRAKIKKIFADNGVNVIFTR